MVDYTVAAEIVLMWGRNIVETVGEVAVELRETRLENKRVREGKERKGAAEYFRANLTHLLNLVQVTDAQDLPPVWEAQARASKHQQLLVLQRAFDGTAEVMGLCCPTIATPSLLSILNPRTRTNFSRDGVAMVGAQRPISSAVPSNACCSTRSC